MIAITGASGPLGRTIADIVLQTVNPREVVLGTRRPEALDDLARRGVHVRKADFMNPVTLKTAFLGVDRLLLISTDGVGSRLDMQRSAVAAALDVGVQHIIYTSMPEPVQGNPAHGVADHAGTEQVLRDSGVRWTFLRNNLYSHMQIPGIASAMKFGRFMTNGGAGAAAYVTREDCAAAAAVVLTRDGHADKTYNITGPEAVTSADLAALASTLGNSKVELVNLGDAEYVAGLQAAGLPKEIASLAASFGASTREGYFAKVSTSVADLTGRRPVALPDLFR